MIIGKDEAEEEGLLTIAKLMLVSARTAPKGMGRDSILTAILAGDEKDKLTEELLKKRPRDGWSLQQSSVVVLIGVKIPEDVPEGRQNMKFMDLGIALGSAVKTAMNWRAPAPCRTWPPPSRRSASTNRRDRISWRP